MGRAVLCEVTAQWDAMRTNGKCVEVSERLKTCERQWTAPFRLKCLSLESPPCDWSLHLFRVLRLIFCSFLYWPTLFFSPAIPCSIWINNGNESQRCNWYTKLGLQFMIRPKQQTTTIYYGSWYFSVSKYWYIFFLLFIISQELNFPSAPTGEGKKCYSERPTVKSWALSKMGHCPFLDSLKNSKPLPLLCLHACLPPASVRWL